MRIFRSLHFLAFIFLGPFALAWLGTAIIYAVNPVYIDHMEPTMVVTSQQWMHGRPLYESSNSAYLYSLLQGPFDYLWLSFALGLIPDPILASKLSGGFWSLASLVLLVFVFRRPGGFLIAVAGLGLVALELMWDLLPPFWDRPDPILIFSTGLGLAALSLQNKRGGAVFLILAIALAIASKIHGGLYLIPCLAIWYRRQGWTSSLGVIGIGIVIAFLPFVLPGISLRNYIFWLQMGTHQRWTLDFFEQNIGTLLLMFLPLVFFIDHPRLKISRNALTEEVIMAGSLLLAGLLISIPASKVGAGWHHLLPLATYVGYLFCVLLANATEWLPIRWSTLTVLVLVFWSYWRVTDNVSYVIWYLQNMPYVAIQEDLHQILRVYPATKTQMGVGHGEGYMATFYSPWIYREGAPCVISIGTYMDMKEAGLNAHALQTSLENEQFPYWLIPRDGPPFSMNSWYPGNAPLFDDAVREAFAKHYELTNSTEFFDVYKARTHSL